MAPESQPRLDSASFFNQQLEPVEALQELVRSCLQDPTFPNFVRQVEAAMREILDDHSDPNPEGALSPESQAIV